jgi:hypothetical protein
VSAERASRQVVNPVNLPDDTNAKMMIPNATKLQVLAIAAVLKQARVVLRRVIKADVGSQCMLCSLHE